MGFNTTASTITLTAKFTPLGRQRLVSTNSSLISTFSLGDSDANYYASNLLSTGEVPSLCGDVGPNATLGNSVFNNINLRSTLVLNPTGVTKKSVSSQSANILTETIYNGQTTVSGSNLTFNVIDRTNTSNNSLLNLYYTFGLPLNSTDDANFTGVTYANGGYSDTALSAVSTTKIVTLAINNASYGEVIDGKTVKIALATSAGTYNIYGTYENINELLTVEDANVTDTSINTTAFGGNVAFLFSDDIMTPNGGSGSLSWATGYGTDKPFSLNNKQLYNLQTDSNVSASADTIVGIAYLDKGFLVLTNPQIVADCGDVATTGATTATTVSFNSVSTSIYQNVTCIADRGEFGSTTNPTFGPADSPRISEIALYDNLDNLIAIGKTDRHISKNINEFLALSVKITL